MSFTQKLEGMFPGTSIDDILINHSEEVSRACVNADFLDELGYMIQGLRERGLINPFLI